MEPVDHVWTGLHILQRRRILAYMRLFEISKKYFSFPKVY